MIGLPYGSFMKQVIEEIIVQNKLYQLQKYWDIPKPHCKLLEGGESLGLEKLISAFHSQPASLPAKIFCTLEKFMFSERLLPIGS